MNRRPLTQLLLVTLFAALTLSATPGRAAEQSNQLDRLLGLTLRSPFLRARAGLLLDGIGPRLAGTPNGRRAEELAVESFREAGVPLVRTELVTVPLWLVRRANLTFVEPTSYSSPVVPLANSASTPPQGLLVPVVDGGYGTREELAALGDRARGAAVLVRTGAPKGHAWIHRSDKYADAVEAGAAVFLYAPSAPGRPMRSGTVTLSGAPGPIPALSMPAEPAAWILRLLSQGKEVKVRVTLVADRISATANNVIADIPGRLPDESILVGAHLDSWDRGQGAGDNGTGTLVLWQVARSLVEQGIRPRRTIRFVSFTGEELGLLGSRDYVRRHSAELAAVRAMINLDMVGEPVGFGVMLQPKAIPFLHSLARRLTGFGLSEDVPDRSFLFSDHAPFLLAGVPVLSVRSRIKPEIGAAYHSARDTFEKLDLGRQQRAAAVTAALVWELANSEELPTEHLTPVDVEAALEQQGVDVKSSLLHPPNVHPEH